MSIGSNRSESLRNRRPHTNTRRNRLCCKVHHRRLICEPLEDRRLLSVGVGGRVWGDANSNGIQDAGEAGILGAVVEVYSSTDTTIGNADDVSCGIAITDTDGNYDFTDLRAGINCYEVFRTPVGFAFTTQDAGAEDAFDSDANAIGITGLFTIAADSVDATRDAGLVGSVPDFGFALIGGKLSGGGSGSQSVATDAAGTSYMTGCFAGTSDFDPGPGTYNLTSGSSQGTIFVAKYSQTGALVWARPLNGLGQNEGRGIAVASDGSVYTTGRFQGTVDFDPGSDAFNLTVVAGSDIFVSKLDAFGNFVWARSMGGGGWADSRGIALGDDGGIYTTGYFVGTADFNPGDDVFNLTSAGSSDIFVSKLDASGDFVWACRMGGTNYDYSYAIAVASDGSVCTTGDFNGTADFDPGDATVNLTSAGGSDVFVSKLDSSGHFVWARSMGGEFANSANGIAVAEDGSVYTTGSTCGTGDFDPGAGVVNLTSEGEEDIFVSKLDASGNFVWARRMGGTVGARGMAIALGIDGGVYTTGAFTGTVDFDPGPGTFGLTKSDGVAAYVSKLDSAGNFVWARQTEDVDGSLATGMSIAMTSDGSVYTTGNFIGVWDFDPGDESFILRTHDNYGYVWKLNKSSFSLGGRVWNDLDGDGIQDSGEPGVLGAVAEVFSSTDTTIGGADDVSCGIAITDENGNYTIGGLLSGVNYYEVFRTPVGFTFTAQDAGSDDTRDSDASSTGVTAMFTVSAGQSDATRDAGLVGAAPGFGFAMRAGAGNNDCGYSVAVATDGTVYSTGTISGTVDFDSGPGTYNVPGPGAYLARYSATGALLWARCMSTDSSATGESIALAGDGSAYVTGSFSGTVDFDPGPDIVNLTSAGSTDIFICKLDSAGDFMWARRIGGTGDDWGCSIAAGPDGSVCATGTFFGTVDFDPGEGTYNLPRVKDHGNHDIFVSKLDSAGNLVWARALGGINGVWGNSITVAADGSVYTTGDFYEAGDFDPGPDTYTLVSAGNTDIYVSKLDAAGNFVWARAMGGAGMDSATSIAVAADGSVYTTGYFLGTADFDPGEASCNLTAAGNFDAYVSKLDTSGNFVWARAMGGTGMDWAASVAIAADGNVYTTGFFYSTADFDPGAGCCNITSAGQTDVYVSVLDSQGSFGSVRRIGGTNHDRSYSIAVGADYSVYSTGYFSGAADFDPGTGIYNITSVSGNDAFISKLLPIDINLSGNFIAENQPLYTVVGSFSRSNSGPGETFSYVLVSGAGGDDNALFAINDSGQLLTDAVFDYETKASYSIRVRMTDNSGIWYDEAFTIVVTDVNEPAPGSIGDRVWNDLNGNGVQDAGEPGVLGAVVEVYSSTDTTLGNDDDVFQGRAITDADGNYSIGGLLPGVNYYEVFRTPVGFTFTTQDAGSDDTRDSDASSTGVTAMFTVSAGQTDATRDAGLVGAAPGFGWAGKIGGIDTDIGDSIAVAPDGNVYAIGHTGGTSDLDLGPGLFNVTSLSGMGILYIAKYTSTGALIWGRQADGTSSVFGDNIAVDGDGAVFVTGEFYGTADFDPGAGTYNLASAGEADVFVLKLDSSGNFVWARSMGGNGYDIRPGIALAPDGSVCIVGDFEGTADFDPGAGTYNLASAGGKDIFVSKLDSSGNFVWARSMGSSYHEYGNAIAVAADGSVYSTGFFSGPADFDPGAETYYLPAEAGNVFVSKLDSSGSFVWARQLGGLEGNSIVVTTDGSVLTTGRFYNTGDFDPGNGACNLVSHGGVDAFVSKLDSSGNFVWARGMGGNGDDRGNDIVVAADGSVYSSGYYQGAADFDPQAGTFVLASIGSSDTYVSKLDSSGNFVWARDIGQNTDDYVAHDIDVTPDGSIYCTGCFSGTSDFDPGTSNYSFTSSGIYNNAFISKLLPISAPTDIELSSNSIAEDQTIGTVVGSVSGIDPDSGEAFTYALVSGIGSDENASFAINSSGQLLTAATFDFETKASCNIRVRTTDYSGMWYEKTFTIAVTDVNEQPTDIALSNANVPENQPSGATVGVFSTADPDAGDTFTYTLAGGEGSTDNASFSISGDRILTAAAFNYEAKNTYTVRVRSTDAGGLFTEKSFTIGVLDVVEVSQAIVVSTDSLTVPEGGTAQFAVTLAVRPEADRTVLITKSTDGDADLTADVASLLFTPDNWNQPQAVTIAAAQNLDAVSGTAGFVLSSAGLADKTVTATEQENTQEVLDWQDTVGLYAPTISTMFLRNTNDTGYADVTFAYGPGNPGWKPIAGDWNNDRTGTIGLFDPVISQFHLRNSNDTGSVDLAFAYGPGNNAGWLPIVGDWDGDGSDTVGLFDPSVSRFYLRNSNTTGYAELTFDYGPGNNAGWLPIIGDWDASGADSVGLFDPITSTFYLRNSNTTGYADLTFSYGPGNNAGWKPIVGDWDGDHLDTVGLFEPSASGFYLRNSNTRGFADVTFAYGPGNNAGWQPIVSDWNGPQPVLYPATVASSAATAAMAPLVEAELQPVVAEALAQLSAAGVSAAAVQSLKQTPFKIADLPDSQVTSTDDGTIYLDRDAADRGWSLDPTVAKDLDFDALAAEQVQTTGGSSSESTRVDLLATVMDELEHLLDIEDLAKPI